jgi:ribosomal protein S18 acetylase RimI-like enzyme
MMPTAAEVEARYMVKPIPGISARHNLIFDIGGSARELPKPLLKAHYEEVASFKSTLKLDPDWREYDRMLKKDEMVLIRAKDGIQTVGYMIVVVKPHLHYKQVKVATDDLHYLHPAYRNLGAGKAMLQIAEKIAIERGAVFVTLRSKAAHNHGYIFEGMGYVLTDLLYVKELTNA